MSLPSAYTSLLNELNRDILRSTPSDPLQFCASWFAQRLEQDRIRARAGQPNPISPQPSLIGYTSSDNQPVYSTHPTAYSGLPQIATYSPQPIPTIGYSHLSPSFTSLIPSSAPTPLIPYTLRPIILINNQFNTFLQSILPTLIPSTRPKHNNPTILTHL